MSGGVTGLRKKTAARDRLEASVAATLDELALIGATPDGGVTRVAWSTELLAAYEWIAARMRTLGLEVEVDAAGNLLGRWEVGRGRPVVVGSHLDTVPSGGRFDGALGVVAALHAVRLLQEEGFEPERPLWIVAFMDEEGTRFGTALFGSRAFTGEDVAQLGDRVDAAGTWPRPEMPPGSPGSAPTSSSTSNRAPSSSRKGSTSAWSRRSSGCAATGYGSRARRIMPGRRPCHYGATRSPAPRGSCSSSVTRHGGATV
jgi:hypothetical protein